MLAVRFLNTKLQMKQQTFSREQVVKLIDNLLQDPDMLLDAVQNENTDWDAERLLEKAEEDLIN